MDHAVGDLDAVETVRPADLRAARDALAESERTGSRVLIRGAGTARHWGAPVGEVDLVLDTTGLDNLVAYNPADMTVAVGAGMSLDRLQEQLDGQRVALDAARVRHGATLGGLLATGDGGPLRAAYGTLRDLVIGATIVLADGTVARSGGHVIKNVAGYDLAKLFCGSLGAFGLVAELVLRLHPRPAVTATVAVPVNPEAGWRLGAELLRSPLEPVALDWHAERLLVRFEGTADAVARRTEKALELAGATASRLEKRDEDAAWDGVAALVEGADGDTVLRSGTRPDRMPALANRLRELAGANGVTAELTSSVAIGVHTVRLRGSAGGAAAHAAVVDGWRAEVTAGGGGTTLHRRVAGLDAYTTSWAGEPGGAAVLRALKRELDPAGRLCPGRFAPWF